MHSLNPDALRLTGKRNWFNQRSLHGPRWCIWPTDVLCTSCVCCLFEISWQYLNIKFQKNPIQYFCVWKIISGDWFHIPILAWELHILKPLSQLIPLIWPTENSGVMYAPHWVCLWYWIWTAEQSQGQGRAFPSSLSCSWFSVSLPVPLCWSLDNKDTEDLACDNYFSLVTKVHMKQSHD